MIHIRVDDQPLNSKRKFACGIGPSLPKGDTYYFAGELSADRADCPGCNPDGPRQLGTPLSQLSGRPGHPGFEKFVAIARSWGFDDDGKVWLEARDTMDGVCFETPNTGPLEAYWGKALASYGPIPRYRGKTATSQR